MICPWCNHNNVPGRDLCANCEQDLSQLDRPVAHDRVERSLMDDTVGMLAPQAAVTLSPSACVAEAIRVMLTGNMGAVAIVDDTGQLIGIFTERDLLLKVIGQEGEPLTRPVTDFMTTRLETVRETDSLAFALHKMDVGGYRHLPVLRGGRLTGMISVRDLLRHITRLCRCAEAGL